MIDKIINILEKNGSTIKFLSGKTGIEYFRLWAIINMRKVKLSTKEHQALEKFLKEFSNE
jgi:hypothetical protein